MQNTDFLAGFIAGTLEPADFDHAAHLRAACLLLQTRPFLEACIAMRDGLRHIASRAGKPQLYHETITVAFMAIVADKLAQTAASGGNEARIANERDLFDRALLSSYYSPDLLNSSRARNHFVLPDRVPAIENA